MSDASHIAHHNEYVITDPELNFEDEEEPSLENVLNAVLQGVKFPRKEIAEKSSCVLGLILRQIMVREKDKNKAKLPSYCLGLSEVLSSKLESKFIQKDGIDSIASCVCAISSPYPQFLKRSLFLKIMSAFRKLKPRSRYEFLQATYVSTDIFPTSTSTSTSSASSSSYEKSGDGSIINYLKPFLSSLLTDLSTVVIRYNNNPTIRNKIKKNENENEYENKNESENDNKAVLPRIRLPMVQLLTVKLLVRYASTLDLELLEELVQGLSVEDAGDTGRGDTGDTGKGYTGDTGHGLAMVLDEKSVLQVLYNTVYYSI